MSELEQAKSGFRGSELWDFVGEGWDNTAGEARKDSSQHRHLVALVLDQILATQPETAAQDIPLRQMLATNPGLAIREAIGELPSASSQILQKELGHSGLQEILALSQDSDSEMFAGSLLAWAKVQERGDRLTSAAIVYQLFQESPSGKASQNALRGIPEALRQEARDRWSVLQGGGPTGKRIEFQLDRFWKMVFDPSMVVGMAVGSTIFTVARSALLGRLLNAPTRNLLTRGFGAHAISSSAALFPEVGGFWGTSKLINEAWHPGSQKWDAATNWHEMRSLFVTLAALKTVGHAFGHGARWTQSNDKVWQQGGMLLGIMGGHGLEQYWGWRDPQSFGSLLTDSLIFVGQFNLAGKLSQHAFSKLYANNQLLTRQVEAQELAQTSRAQSALQQGLSNLFPGGRTGGSTLAWAGAGAGSAARVDGLRSVDRGTQEAADLYVKSEGSDEEGGSGRRSSRPPARSSRPPARRTRSSAEHAIIPDFDQQYRPDELPARTGKIMDSKGDMVIDRLVQSSRPRFAHEMLERLNGPSREALLRQLGFSEHTQVSEGRLSSILDQDFGYHLGTVWRETAQQYFDRELDRGLKKFVGKPVSELPPDIQGILNILHDLTHVAFHAHRAGRTDVTGSFEETLGEDGLARLPILDRGLREFFGLNALLQQGVIGMNEGALAHGAGAMAVSMLVLCRHLITPGGRGLYTPLIISTRNQEVANEINSQGLNTKDLDTDRRVNYRYDPPIMAIGPQGLKVGDQVVTREQVAKAFQFQMLMLPSKAHASYLTQEFVEGLPKFPNTAHLLHVSKGFIGEDRGAFRPGLGEQPTLLPFELDNMALARYGRTDVEIVSGGGFTPDKWVITHRPVTMVFSSREDGSHGRPGADAAAVAVAGANKSNAYIKITTDHHQKSTEFGGGIKNITALRAGELAFEFALNHLERGDRDSGPQSLNEQFENESFKRLFKLALEALGNEKEIKPDRVKYSYNVKDDFENCWKGNILNVIELARQLKADIASGTLDVRLTSRIEDYIVENVITKRYEFADVRGFLVGLIGGIVKYARSQGSKAQVRDIPIDDYLTTEGMDSLAPLVRRNNFQGYPHPLRRYDDAFYRSNDFYNPNRLAVPPNEIPPEVQRALAGEVSGVDQQVLNKALEGRSQPSVNNLEYELGILRNRRATSVDGEEADVAAMDRQTELVAQYVDAMRHGEIGPVRDFPTYIKPYENMFVIPLDTPEGGRPTRFRVFIKVDSEGAMDRLTQMGTVLNHFKHGDELHVDVQMTGLETGDLKGSARHEILDRKEDITQMAQLVVDTFHRFRKARTKGQRSEEGVPKKKPEPPKITLYFNGQKVSAAKASPPEFDMPKYMRRLHPLDERRIPAATVFDIRERHTRVLNQFMKNAIGWPMLLGYYGGPIQRAIKAGIARPEKKTLIGIYDGENLIEAFFVYRRSDNQPRVLNQHVISEFSKAFPDREEYKDPSAQLYYEGLPLEQFLTDYEAYAGARGHEKLVYKVMDFKAMPVENGLAERVGGFNPYVLRRFTMERHNPESDKPNPYVLMRDAMLKELDPYYGKNFRDSLPELREIFARYLEPYEEAHREVLESDPLYEIFEKDGPHALANQIFRRDRSQIPNDNGGGNGSNRP